MHADQLALFEKLDANHRELLAALERQATRINALGAGLARVDERTRKQPSNPLAQSLARSVVARPANWLCFGPLNRGEVGRVTPCAPS
jgi:hypothetical protein